MRVPAKQEMLSSPALPPGSIQKALCTRPQGPRQGDSSALMPAIRWLWRLLRGDPRVDLPASRPDTHLWDTAPLHLSESASCPFSILLRLSEGHFESPPTPKLRSAAPADLRERGEDATVIRVAATDGTRVVGELRRPQGKRGQRTDWRGAAGSRVPAPTPPQPRPGTPTSLQRSPRPASPPACPEPQSAARSLEPAQRVRVSRRGRRQRRPQVSAAPLPRTPAPRAPLHSPRV